MLEILSNLESLSLLQTSYKPIVKNRNIKYTSFLFLYVIEVENGGKLKAESPKNGAKLLKLTTLNLF